MSISDTNPERRNLTITSLCFIIYVLGEGNLAGDQIRLQVVNVSFNNPQVLCFGAWILLFWFGLRYWQINKGEARRVFEEEIKSLASSRSLIAFIEKRIGKKYREPNGFYEQKIERYRGDLRLSYGNIQGGTRNARGEFINFSTKGREYIGFDGILGRCLLLYLWLKMFLTKPGFGNYLMPYIMLFFAIMFGCYRLLFGMNAAT